MDPENQPTSAPDQAENKQEKQRFPLTGGSLIMGLLLFVGMIVVLYCVDHTPGVKVYIRSQRVWVIIACAAAYPIDIVLVILHELGHVLAGWLVGFRFRWFAVGPLALKRTSRGVIWKRNRTVNQLGGLAVMIPSSAVSRNSQIACYAIGGVIVNFLIAGIAWWVLLKLPMFSPLKAFVAVAGILSLAKAVQNSIPRISKSGFPTDGYQVWRSLFSSLDVQQQGEKLVFSAVAQLQSVARPRELDVAGLEGFVTRSNPSLMTANASILIASHYDDLKDFENAQLAFDRATEQAQFLPQPFRDNLNLEYAVFLGEHGGDCELLRTTLDDMEPNLFTEGATLNYAKAVLAYWEDEDLGNTIKLLDQAHQDAQLLFDIGIRISVLESIENLRKKVLLKQESCDR